MFDRFSKVLRKNISIAKRARAAFDEGRHLCESCGVASNLSELNPLTISPCEKCGFNGFIPYLLHDYLLYEPLGAGGVSSVYKAVRRDTYTRDRFYAIKLLRSDKAIDEDVRHAFTYEAEVHHTVSPHPSIVPFIELGHEGDVYFHAMDFIPGDTLKRRVEASGRIEEKTALIWSLQLLQALRHILAKGFLYRDISPGNLLIRADQSICLIDFGLVLSIGEADAKGHANIVAGTPEYMPPERIQQVGEDERSLIYSLGMLLIYMLKGEPLIKGTSHKKAALQHVSTVRVAFSENMLPPDVSIGVTEIIRAMINYDPVDRPESLDVTGNLLNALIRS